MEVPDRGSPETIAIHPSFEFESVMGFRSKKILSFTITPYTA
jgi:hypothetical protein